MASSGSLRSARLGVGRLGVLGGSELVRLARLARLSGSGGAETGPEAALAVGIAGEEVRLLGAFQRPSELATAPAACLRRGSGGGAVLLRPGGVWVQLRLGRIDALVPELTPGAPGPAGPSGLASGEKLLNRYVRPLLAALTRVAGVPVSYFGRDWLAARHAPVASVGFAHDAATGQAAVEAFVGLRFPVAAGTRASFRGKQPSSLEEAARRPVDPERTVDAIVEAYAALAATTEDWDVLLEGSVPPGPPGDESQGDPPWVATRQEAIGLVAAGPDAGGVLRLGGELMASADVVDRLGRQVAALPRDAAVDEVGRLVDGAFGADASPSAMLFGVRSLVSLRDVLAEARQNMA